MSLPNNINEAALTSATKVRNNLASLMKVINILAQELITKGIMTKFSDSDADGTFATIKLSKQQIEQLLTTVDSINAHIKPDSTPADIQALLRQPQYRLVLPMGVIGSLDTAVSIIKPHVVTENFISVTYKYWDAISTKDDKYFMDHFSEIFNMGGADSKSLTVMLLPYLYKVVNLMFKADLVSDQIKNTIWSCLYAVLRLSVNYTHHARGPFIKHGEKGHQYTVAGAKEGESVAGAPLGDDLEQWADKLNMKLVYSQ